MVAAALRAIFAQPTTAEVALQLDEGATMLERQLPKVEATTKTAWSAFSARSSSTSTRVGHR